MGEKVEYDLCDDGPPAIALAVIQSVRSPVVGTYRFVVRLPSGDSTTLFARTEAQGFVVFTDQPVAASPDSTVWRGSVDVLGTASRIVRDTAVANRFAAAEWGLRNLLLAREISFAEGRFIAYGDGRMRYETRVPAVGQLLYSIHGERISTTIIPRR